jgi:hypothetical protein
MNTPSHKHIVTHQTWHVRSESQDVKRGRLCNYSEMTEFLVILTVAHDRPDLSKDEYDKIPSTSPIRDWTAEDWRGMKDSLVAIRLSMLRVDANAPLDDEGSRSVIKAGDKFDRDRGKNRYFSSNFYEVLKRFTLHERLAPFRSTLEGDGATMPSKGAKRKGGNKGPLQVPEKFLEDFL